MLAAAVLAGGDDVVHNLLCRGMCASGIGMCALDGNDQHDGAAILAGVVFDRPYGGGTSCIWNCSGQSGALGVVGAQRALDRGAEVRSLVGVSTSAELSSVYRAVLGIIWRWWRVEVVVTPREIRLRAMGALAAARDRRRVRRKSMPGPAQAASERVARGV